MKCQHCDKEIQPEKISVFDPSRGAYREVSVDEAKKIIKAAEELKKLVPQTEEDKP